MWIVEHAGRFRAAMLGVGLGLLGPAAGASAASLSVSTAEPFGLPAATLSDGALREKWQGVERELDDELLVLTLCQEDRTRCQSTPAVQFLAIVDHAAAREGRARLGEINRAINLAIRPVSDLSQYGSLDVWSSPLATFAAGAGDCEDYAIAKFVALRVAGVAAQDLRLVILHDSIRQEDHAVVAARLEGRWLMLDNRRMAMIEDGRLRNLRPTFVIDHEGVRQYSPMPPMMAERHPEDDQPAARAVASPAGIVGGR